MGMLKSSADELKKAYEHYLNKERDAGEDGSGVSVSHFPLFFSFSLFPRISRFDLSHRQSLFLKQSKVSRFNTRNSHLHSPGV
jgi:hypothetical protein